MKSANLAIVFVDIAGFTERTSNQSRAQSERWLARFEQLIMPLLRALGGKRIKTIGDAYLCTFASPTNALLFAMAAQDRLCEYNGTVQEENRFFIRVALGAGEVRLKKGDVYGEPVNIAARIEAITPAGEIWFSESVYLAMTKSEVPAQKVGARKLKGISEEIMIYRVPPDNGYRLSSGHDAQDVQTATEEWGQDRLPFGGLGLKRAEQNGWAMSIGAGQELVAHAGRRVAKGLARVPIWIWVTGLALVLISLVFGWMATSRPLSSCIDAIDNAQFSKAQLLLDSDPDRMSPLGKAIQARIWLRQSQQVAKGTKFLEDAIAAQPALLADDEVIEDLVLSLNRRRAKSTIEFIASKVGSRALEPALKATMDKRYWLRWNAIEVLKKIGEVDKIDLAGVYILDLEHAQRCSVRKKAAQRLAELKDKRALEPLEAARRRNFFENICMGSTLENAIKAIEK